MTPEQVVDVLALMGDSIDNIKGVPGIGEKGARDLIAHLRHARVPAGPRFGGCRTSATAKACWEHADAARQSRELARIRTDVPVEFEPESMRYRGSSQQRCFELFSRLGFRSLVMEFAPTAQTVGKDYTVVDTLDGVRKLAEDLRAAGRLGLRVLPIRAVGDAGIDRGPVILDGPAPGAATCHSPAAASGSTGGWKPVRRSRSSGPFSKIKTSGRSVTT